MLPSKKTPLDFPFRHSGNPDKYGQSLGGDFAQVQANFDKRAEFNQTQINAILDALASVTDGDSGADNVKATPLTGGTADTVQGILEELKASEGTLDGQNVKLTGNQTVNDIKTFTSSPIVPTPTTSSQAASKSYVDATVGAVVIGQIPDGSLTDVKLSDTTGQIKDRVNVLRTDVDKLELETEYNNKAIAEMQMFLELESKIPSKDNNKFYTNFIDSFIASAGVVDLTTQNYTGTLSSGATSVTVTSATGFAKGQEISIQNNVSYEDVIIDSVVGNTINFKTPLVNTYTNPRIYRSNNNTTGFGTTGQISVTYDRQNVTVVSAAPTSADVGSRKLLKLSNGWLVAGVRKTTSPNTIDLYVSKDEGATPFTYQCSFNSNDSGNNDIASLVCKGTVVYGVGTGDGSTTVVFYKADFATNPTGVISGPNILETGLTMVVDCSIAINAAGTELCIAYSFRTAALNNSHNVKVVKGTINADGSVAWGSIVQVTNDNLAGNNNFKVCVIYVLNTPLIIFNQKGSTPSAFNTIRCYNVTSSAFTSVSLGGSYDRSNPCAIYIPQSVNGLTNGRAWASFDGRDATNPSKSHIFVSYSDDLGATWSSPVKLTSDLTNTYEFMGASITADKNNKIHIICNGKDASSSYYNLFKLVHNGTSWSTATRITNNTTDAYIYPQTMFDLNLDFTLPLFIATDQQNSKVGFYGKWTEISDSPVIKNVIRININPYINCTEAQAWLTKSELAGFTVDGKVSFKALVTDDESYIDLVETITDLGSTNEISMTGVSTVPSKHITLKLILERASTSDIVSFTKLVGGVA